MLTFMILTIGALKNEKKEALGMRTTDQLESTERRSSRLKMDNDINTNSCCRSITRDVGRHLFASRFLKQCPVDQTAPTETMENINLICHSRALYEKGV